MNEGGEGKEKERQSDRERMNYLAIGVFTEDFILTLSGRRAVGASPESRKLSWEEESQSLRALCSSVLSPCVHLQLLALLCVIPMASLNFGR